MVTDALLQIEISMHRTKC